MCSDVSWNPYLKTTANHNPQWQLTCTFYTVPIKCYVYFLYHQSIRSPKTGVFMFAGQFFFKFQPIWIVIMPFKFCIKCKQTSKYLERPIMNITASLRRPACHIITSKLHPAYWISISFYKNMGISIKKHH